MDITFPWGTTKTYTLTATDPDNQPVVFDGKNVVLMAKKLIADDDDQAVIELTVGDGITPNGTEATIKIDPARTATLDRAKKNTLYYQLLLIAGTDRFPLKEGKMIITPSVQEA